MKKLVIAMVVISAFGSSVFAGEMKKEGSASLGYGMPGSDWGDYVDGGIALGFGYEGYKINDMFSVGGEFMYVGGSGSVGTVDYTTSVWGLLPYGKYSKEVDMGGKKLDLYGLFGMGIYGASVECDGVSASESEFGFNLGGGVMFPINDKMKIGGDLRYHLISSEATYFIPSVKFVMSF